MNFLFKEKHCHQSMQSDIFTNIWMYREKLKFILPLQYSILEIIFELTRFLAF